MSQHRLLAEWEPQSAVLLTWPHADTDWAWILGRAQHTYLDLAFHITRFAHLLIAAPAAIHQSLHQALQTRGVDLAKVQVYDVPSNDTWARDHGPLTVATESGLQLLDFCFNGWGNKYPAQLDNQITQRLAEAGAFAVPVSSRDLVLEGGAIETDGADTLLTTEACLLNPNRNPHLSREEIEACLMREFGVRKINWLSAGYLQGDDTDSHIDTLARLCPQTTLAYVQCDDPQDPHFSELQAMQACLQQMSDADGRPYRLVPLPWPQAKYNAAGERLPATYANFLILNGAVLVPVYADPRDAEALSQVGKAFPGYEIVPIDCQALIEQHGSLHCVTMQLPEGVYCP